MNTKLFPVVLCFALLNFQLTQKVFATDTPATAATLTLSSYFSDTGTGTPCLSIAGTLGGASGVPACTGVASNDSWYQFTATTQGIRINVTTTNFDAVVELLEVGSLNSLECTNDNGANSGEILRYNALTEGDTYLVRVHSAGGGGGTFNVCGQFYPQAFVTESNSPFPAADDAQPGYKVAQTLSRNLIAPNGIIQATRWFLTDVDSGDEITFQVNGGSTNLNLNAIGSICFGRTYDVVCEIQTEGFWCGTSISRPVQMEEFPFAEPSPGINGSTITLANSVTAGFLASGNQFEWRFTTDNGNTVFTQIGAPNTTNLFLSTFPCVRYNRIYTLEVRANVCGEWGPWSEPIFFLTPPVPYIKLVSSLCDQSFAPNGLLQTEFTPGNAGYIWQFAPIEFGDEDFTPIGPAIVTTTSNQGLFLGPLGLTNGTSYRVATKAIFSGCGTYQEGDYGEFCQITIGTPSGLQARMSEEELQTDVERQIEEQLGINLYPNPMSGQVLNIEIEGLSRSELADLEVFDLNGRIVHADQVYIGAESNWFQMEFPSTLTHGTYMVSLRTSERVFTTRFVKTAR